MRTTFAARQAVLALSCAALAAGSTALRAAEPSVPALVVPPVRVASFGHPEVDEAAKAYAVLYAQAVTGSLQAGKYLEPLAYRQANAESCLSSRVYRLLGREITDEEKRSIISALVTPEQIRQYQELSKGYFLRANAMELFSCEHAGLKVASNIRY